MLSAVPRARVFVAVLALLVVPTAAFAQDSVEEAEDKAERLQDEAAAARDRFDRLEGQAAVTRDQLDRLQGQVATVRERLAAARAELDRLQPKLEAASIALSDAQAKAAETAEAADLALAQAERAKRRLDASLARLAENESKRASVVRDAYMYGPGVATPEMAVLRVAEGTTPTEVASTVHMLDVLLLDHSLLVDRSVELAHEARRLAGEAEQAKRRAAAEAARAEKARQAASQRHAEMLALLAEAERAVTAEAQAVADLRAQRAAANRHLRQLRKAKRDAAATATSTAEAAREAAARAEELAEQAAASVSATPVNSWLVTVGGITVARSIGDELEALLNAARADGIVLGGYGYRSVQTTIALRRANGCPDIYESPASACRVPTARPGTSMHEQGLAIDFTWQGRTICYPHPPSACHGNPAFDWLQAHAASYGLYGLSSEAWHYSANGR